jgi:hypothetical protein
MALAISLIAAALVLLLPDGAHAWGPLTHASLGTEVLAMGTALPAALYALLKRHRQCWLYGNVMADAILGRKYQPSEVSTHNWDVAFSLHDDARTEAEVAFTHGFLCHLAADTVAHGPLTEGLTNMGHALLEMKADSAVPREHRLALVRIPQSVRTQHDRFMSTRLERTAFSFQTNRRIFHGIVALSALNTRVAYLDPHTLRPGFSGLHELRADALERMVDVLASGRESAYVRESAICDLRPGRLVPRLLAARR